MTVRAGGVRAWFLLLVLSGLVFAWAQARAETPVRRIVSLAPNLTELAYSAGAGELLVGADMYSDYPPQARQLPRVGDAFQVDYERVLALKPDLVLVWVTGTPESVIERLTSLGLRVERIETSRLEDIAAAIERIGRLAGTEATAHRNAQEFLREVAEVRAQRPGGEPLRVFYQISEQPLYTVNGEHLISEIIELCGGRNVFAELPQLAPPVGLEAVLERNPEVIVTADGAQGDPLSVWRRWPTLDAVTHGALFTVHADYVARATPRIIEGVHEMCRVLEQARSSRTERRQ